MGFLAGCEIPLFKPSISVLGKGSVVVESISCVRVSQVTVDFNHQSMKSEGHYEKVSAGAVRSIIDRAAHWGVPSFLQSTVICLWL